MATTTTLTSGAKRARTELSNGLPDTGLRTIRRDVVSLSELESLRAELEHEQAMRALDEKRFQQSTQRLERQIRFAVEEADEAKAMLDDVRDKSEAHVKNLRLSRDRAVEDLREVQLELQEMHSAEAMERMERSEDPEIFRLQQIVQAKSEENDGLAQQVKTLKVEAQQLLEKTQNKPRETLVPPSLSTARPDLMKEMNRVRVELSDSNRKCRQLSRAVDDWQTKAKQLAAEGEASRYAALRLEQVELEFQKFRKDHEVIVAQMQSWKDFGRALQQLVKSETTNFDIPPELTAIQRVLEEAKDRLHKSEESCSLLEQELGNAKMKLSKMELQGSSLSSAYEKQDHEKGDMQAEVARLNQELSTLRAQEHIWKRETESLRTLVKTFDDMPKGAAEDGASSQASSIAMAEQLKSAQQEIEVLTAARDESKKGLEALVAEKEMIMTKFNKIKEAVYAEREKAAKAEERAIQAETLAGKGAFDPEHTKVLHLQSNPLSEALRNEVIVLKKQLKVLTTDKATKIANKIDVDPDKLHQRLKQSFKEQIGRFREGVYLMTGYKIDMIPGDDRPTFRVRSMFAEKETDHLMLRWPQGDDAASLDIMDTELARLLTTTPSYQYMTKFHSLPTFMASVQLSLFEKQTMM